MCIRVQALLKKGAGAEAAQEEPEQSETEKAKQRMETFEAQLK